MIGLQNARKQLEPLNQPIIEAHKAATATWEELVTKHAHFARPLDDTARANFIHCHLQAELEPRVGDLAEITDCLGFFALKVSPLILLRFKFVGLGTPSNVRTFQQKDLAGQLYTEQMTLALTGDLSIPPPTMLTCGYTLDGAKLGRIEIRRDCNGHLPWYYDIYGGDAVNLPLVLDGLADDPRPATIKSASRKLDRKGEVRAEEA